MATGGISRVSDQLQVNTLLTSLRNTNTRSSLVQQQMATGNRLLTPSTDPAASNQVMSLQRILAQQAQVMANLSNTSILFSQTDSSLGEASSLLLDAKVIASDSIGATDAERESGAQLIQSIIDSLVGIGNTQVGDTFIFGGIASATPPFINELNGVHYLGSDQVCTADCGGVAATAVGLTGAEVFGVENAGVEGQADLTPAMTADTRLADLGGTAGAGVRKDAIIIADGTNTIRVDLSGADRIGDVVDAVNAAGGGVITASIAADGVSLQIESSAAGADLTVVEAGSGRTAHDLGLFTLVGQGASLNGDSVRPALTETTALADLAGGAGLDLTSGLIITNGGVSETIDFSADATVGDMLNRINNAGVGVQASVNADGTGIDIVNMVSGSAMTIGENGGTTAADLGVRTLRGDSDLDAFNDGVGVRRVDGKADLRITTRDGSAFDVDLSAAETLDDVVAAVNAAATAAGVAVTASIQTVGNGVVLTDGTGGAGSLSAISINGGAAAEDLGLAQSVDADTLAAEDTNPVLTGGVFADLAQLRDALLAGDDAAITRLAGRVEDDYDDMVSLRARMGGLVADLESRVDRQEAIEIDNLARLSELKDTDYTEAVTQFTSLQTALEANYMTSSAILNLSLLDYL